MMRRTPFLWASVLLLSGVLSGCSGGSSSAPPSPPPSGSAGVSVTMTDTPPAGVTVLSFEVTVSGATLRSNTGNPDVNLVPPSAPLQIEIKHLETETAFLSTTTVPADTYKDITLTLTNPQFTIQNNSGGTLAGCADGAVCKLQPATSATVIFSAAPFPLTISANSPTGLLVDVNLNNLITSTLGVDFNAAGGVVVQQLPLPGQPAGELDDIEDLTGIVANLDATNKKFTLKTTQGDFSVTADSATRFEDFDAGGCAANDFTCVQNNQVVEVDLVLLAGGAFKAKKIELEDDIADDEVEGVIVSVDTLTQFQMVVREELQDVAGVAVGDIVTVNLQNGTATFRVDMNGLTVPATQLQLFEGTVDTSQLIAGQDVQVRVKSLTTGTPILIATDRVRLRMSRFTATVASVTPPNFFVNGLPALFTSATLAVTQIQVETSLPTDFEGVADVNGLQPGNTVSLRGLLFATTTDPILVASKVRKR